MAGHAPASTRITALEIATPVNTFHLTADEVSADAHPVVTISGADFAAMAERLWTLWELSVGLLGIVQTPQDGQIQSDRNTTPTGDTTLLIDVENGGEIEIRATHEKATNMVEVQAQRAFSVSSLKLAPVILAFQEFAAQYRAA